MRKTIASVLVILFMFLAFSPVGAAETGRYRAYPGSLLILLDTSTGKSWTFDDDGKWSPVEFVRLPGATREKKTNLPFGGRTTPDATQSDRERRRLKMMRPESSIFSKEKPKPGNGK